MCHNVTVKVSQYGLKIRLASQIWMYTWLTLHLQSNPHWLVANEVHRVDNNDQMLLDCSIG